MNRSNINFYCVGAQKAGTTTLHDILIQHPEVYLPKTKEAHFFDEDDKFKLGVDWYINTFFEDYTNEKICGSCNPEYLFFEEVPKRIHETLGKDVKFVFIFRNPVDRAYSHYLMSKRRCIEELSFIEAIKMEEERIKKDYFNKTHFSYVSRGFYSEQVRRYLNYFPIENMFFIRFEDDLIKNRKPTIDNLLDFLELEKNDLDINIKSNVAKSAKSQVVQRFIYKDNVVKSFLSLFVSQKFKNNVRGFLHKLFMKPIPKSKMENNTREELFKKYNNDIIELETIIGKNLDTWKLKYE